MIDIIQHEKLYVSVRPKADDSQLIYRKEPKKRKRNKKN